VPGQHQTFTTAHGPVDVAWKLSSRQGARVGSLRAQAVAVEASAGDNLVLAFRLHDASLEMTRLCQGDMGVQRLLGCSVRNAAAALAAGLDGRRDEVRELLRARGDHELAAMLEAT
jgi:hypothetical protein